MALCLNLLQHVLHKARNLGLYYRLLDVRAVIFKMAVRVVTSTSKWLGCDEYWGFFVLNRTCVVFQWETVQVSAFNHWFAHSPVNKPMARRRILIADDRLDSRLPKQSPVLLLVDNACDYKELIVFPNFSFIIFYKLESGNGEVDTVVCINLRKKRDEK